MKLKLYQVESSQGGKQVPSQAGTLKYLPCSNSNLRISTVRYELSLSKLNLACSGGIQIGSTNWHRRCRRRHRQLLQQHQLNIYNM